MQYRESPYGIEYDGPGDGSSKYVMELCFSAGDGKFRVQLVDPAGFAEDPRVDVDVNAMCLIKGNVCVAHGEGSGVRAADLEHIRTKSKAKQFTLVKGRGERGMKERVEKFTVRGWVERS